MKATAVTLLPSRFGDFLAHAYPGDHLALVCGDVEAAGPVLVRLHSECLTGDTLGSLRCDCGEQRDAALQRIAHARRGVFLYLRQEGRGIGLENKIRAYALQDAGFDTFAANRMLGFRDDERDFGIAAAMLLGLGVRRVRLLTNNPDKVAVLCAHGIDVVARESLVMVANPHNARYLEAKRALAGHALGAPESSAPGSC